LRAKLEEEQGKTGRPEGVKEVLQALFGLRPGAPDVAEKITVKQLAGILNTSGSSVERPDDKTQRDPLVRTVAGILIEDRFKPGDPGREFYKRLAAARNYQKGVNWAGVCFAA
jgi:hypothetical protein